MPPLAPPIALSANGPDVGTPNPNWPDGPTGPAASGQAVAGISCGINLNNLAQHLHPHLSIFVNGQQMRIPRDIGIGGPNAPAPGCMYPLHTHDGIGIVHVESETVREFTLGEFFAIWGQPLTATNVAGFTGMPIVYYVNDGSTVQQFTGDPATIGLLAGRGITIQIGTPLSVIPTYTYN